MYFQGKAPPFFGNSSFSSVSLYFLVFDGGLSSVNESEREELYLSNARVASITVAMLSSALLPTLRESRSYLSARNCVKKQLQHVLPQKKESMKPEHSLFGKERHLPNLHF